MRRATDYAACERRLSWRQPDASQRTEIGPPVDLFEYQAKELFAEYGVPVPKDKVANTAEEAREITTAFATDGIPQVVVKAQVKTGRPGKGGGGRLGDGPC